MGDQRPGYDIYPELYQRRYSAMKASIDDLLTDLCERMHDDNEDYFFESWKDRCYDAIIEGIDWDKLGQCDACSQYYDINDSDAADFDMYCSGLCEEDTNG
jgi:hypothetical protein